MTSGLFSRCRFNFHSEVLQNIHQDTAMANKRNIVYCRALQHLRIVNLPTSRDGNAGVPVLLIRNLDIPRLRNGTRSQITHQGPNIMKATVMTDIGRRESILIPRLPIIPKDLSSQFRRQQIPLKISFARLRPRY
ncbi:hypothetical protein AVEN_208748-1 [Araneus ventricosus]|uniref:ATP-dependent DNA helicase n=1 Tax=Araneus ventricosus TaxID=182803 RepID=A0A4Y2KFS6_ARAVE|nr:hypothetical protein AVEN_208748-1 [Araneus ventricosus]